jgi:hypothetical protein
MLPAAAPVLPRKPTTDARKAATKPGKHFTLYFADLGGLIFGHFQFFLNLLICKEHSRAAHSRAAESAPPASSTPLSEGHIPRHHADRQQRQSDPQKSTHNALSFRL